MTTPTGQISLSDVRLEIYGSATGQIDMNDANVYTLAGLTAGSAISMSDLKGKTWGGGGGGSPAASLSNHTVSGISGTGTANAGFRIAADGSAYQVTTTTTLLETWLDSGTNADFEVMATLTSGTTPTGSALGTWISTTTNSTWSISRSTTGTNTASLTVQIRNASTLAVLTTATISLSAQSG